jgi:predicted kinase
VKIVALFGPCGSGKSTLRKSDPELKDLPCVDIGEVYKQFPGTTPLQALGWFINETEQALREHGSVVVEAHGSPQQREWLKQIAVDNGATYEEREMEATFQECERRILEQYEANREADPKYWDAYTLARLVINKKYHS